ncbi:MAG: fibrobacter succinogenes major paralogous domain-containing protein [Bacteroidales bacterium]
MKTIFRIYFAVMALVLISCKPELEKQKPVVTTTEVSSVTDNAATCGGDAITDNGSFITNKGVCWSVNSHPTVADSISYDGQDEGNYTSRLKGLASNTTYYVRAYATNAGGTDYGSEKSFTTKTSLIATLQPSDIGASKAKCGGNITYYDGIAYSAKGVCWSTSHNPTLRDQHTDDGVGADGFYSYLTNLTPSTTYYIRAFVTCGTETSYGNEVSFTSMSGIVDLSIDKLFPQFSTMAIIQVNTLSIGGSEIIERGVCWSKLSGVSVSDSKATSQIGITDYTVVMSPLIPSTKYYARAYTITASDTYYSNEVSFTTNDDFNTIKDVQGNIYDIAVFGNKTWMIQNLRTTLYANGDSIPVLKSNDLWRFTNAGACCSYENLENNLQKNGRLYNWYAVTDPRKLAPVGWHVATYSDWDDLFKYATSHLGNSAYMLKAIASNSDWESTDLSARYIGFNIKTNNNTGFTALPSGYRYEWGNFYNLGITAFWWCGDGNQKSLKMMFNSESAELVSNLATFGCSIRCVKDN